MTITTVKIPGADAISTLESRRAMYPTTGEYPFLIGDLEELKSVQETTKCNDQTPTDIIQASLNVDLNEWMANRRAEVEENGFSEEYFIGQWPGEVAEKGSITIHTDILSRKIKPEIYLGIARIDHPWHLPAVLKYGAWNECPEPEIHCAFHRKWQAEFDALITGMSADVVECVVKNPPNNQKSAVDLAWQQFWYCADIVEQGCESVNNLAATLLNSKYWFFWWD